MKKKMVTLSVDQVGFAVIEYANNHNLFCYSGAAIDCGRNNVTTHFETCPQRGLRRVDITIELEEEREQ